MTASSISYLIEELRLCGVHLSLDTDGGLKVNAPIGLKPELLIELRRCKSLVVEWLQRAQTSMPKRGLPECGFGRIDGETLTPMQRSLWLTCQLEPGSINYNIPHVLDIRGDFNSALLHECLKKLHQRHGSMRTRFRVVDGMPRQVVDADAELDFAEIAINDEALMAALASESTRVFDLENGPLFFARIFKLADRHHVFFFNFHHIVFDGWSCGVFLRELGELYRAQGASVLEPLPFDYVDFSHWYARSMDEDYEKRAQTFWRAQLDGVPATVDFPTDFPRPVRLISRGAVVPIKISQETTQSARALCRRHDVTLYQLLLSIFQVLLFRYSRQEELVVGVPSANRTFLELESLVGYFVNPLPIRASLNAGLSFADLLLVNKQRMLEMTAYQDFPFEKIVESHNPERSMSYSPVFQHMFSYAKTSEETLDIPGADVRSMSIDDFTAKYDLLFSIQDSADGLSGEIQFNATLYEMESARRWAANFGVMLSSVCEDIAQPIGALPLVHADEHAFILDCLGKGSAPFFSPFQRIQDSFEQWVQKQPTAIALRCGSQAMSYAQLNDRADMIAAYLQANGVRENELVGLCITRTPDLIAGLIAILKLGAAYVPLDPKYPILRLQEIAEDAQLCAVLCDQASAGLVAGNDIRELRVEDASATAGKPLPTAISKDGLAHVIYTSGSTGRPKGVMVTHANVLALLDWVRATYSRDELDSVLCSTSLCFDISVFEIWAPLSIGGSIVLVENATELLRVSPAGLSLINTVPSALRLLVEEAAIPASVKVINVAGEALAKQLVNDLFNRYPDVVLYNLYGPTEDTTYSTFYRITGAVAVDPPIGIPILHSYGRVVDVHGEVVPVGVIGELYLGGNGVTRGYLNRSDLTIERFVRRLGDEGLEVIEYRTGDLVSLHNDGQLEFLGRVDNQVKLRGFRIELGEIEHTLRCVDGVTDACVLVRRQPTGDVLVAYIARNPASASADVALLTALERHLRTHLPDYMVPSLFLPLDQLPLNNSGKVDRHALVNVSVEIAETVPAVQARDDEERTIVDIWRSLLQLDSIGVHDEFFKIGGNSLLAMQMISRVNKAFGKNLPVGVAFECKTVATLAARLRSASVSKALPLERVDTSAEVDIAFPQQGAWHIANMEQFKTFYNMFNAIWLDGSLDAAALQRSIDRLVNRHECLRATFALGSDGVKMCVKSRMPLPLQIVDVSVVDGDDVHSHIMAEMEREHSRVFDLIEGPLVRTLLFRVSEMQHVFVFSIHHLVSDAWSINIVKKELSLFYAQEIGVAAQIPNDLTIHYTDFAYWEKRWHETEPYQRQIDYWHRKLAEVVVDGVFPIDTDASVHTPGTMKYITLEMTGDLAGYANRKSVTPYVVLMAALHLALAGYSKIYQQMVFSPVAGRSRQELEESIGLYVNMIVVVSRITNAMSLDEFVQQIGTNVLDAYANADVSMMAMMQKLKFPLPTMPSVVLNVIDLPNQSDWTLPGLTVRPIELQGNDSPCLTALDIYVYMEGGPMTVKLGYNRALFNEASGRRFAQLFRGALEAIADSSVRQVGDLLAKWQE